jgi:hypothetical protein
MALPVFLVVMMIKIQCLSLHPPVSYLSLSVSEELNKCKHGRLSKTLALSEIQVYWDVLIENIIRHVFFHRLTSHRPADDSAQSGDNTYNIRGLEF